MVSEVTTKEVAGGNAFLAGTKDKKEEKSDLSVSEQFLQLFNSSIFSGIDKESLTANSKSVKAFDSIFAEKAVNLEKHNQAKDYSAQSVKPNEGPASAASSHEADKEVKSGLKAEENTEKDQGVNSRKATAETDKVAKNEKGNNQELKAAGSTSAESKGEKTTPSENQQAKGEVEKNPLQEAIRETHKRQRSAEQQAETGTNKADDSARQSGLASIVAAANKRAEAKAKPATMQGQAVNATEANSEAKSAQSVQPGSESQDMNQNGHQSQNAVLVGQAGIKSASAQAAAKATAEFNSTLKATSVQAAKGTAQTSQNPGLSTAENKAAVKAGNANRTQQLVRANQTEIIQKLVRSAKMNLQNGKQEINMLLKPEELGWLKVKMNIQGQKVTAVITAENEEVKQMLERNIGQLQTSLQSNHLRINQVVVEVSGQNQPALDMNKGGNDLMHQQQNQTGSSSSSKGQNTENDDLVLSEDEQMTRSLISTTDGVVNVTI